MRKLLLFAFVLTSFGLFSQAPKLINYQGVARNSSGVAISNTVLQLTVSISDGSYVYTETQSPTSNAVGIFNVQIGAGFQIGSNTFAGINWGGGSQTMNVIINAGSGPQSLGTQQLVSVPYALFAEKSGSGGGGSYIAGPGIGISSGSIITNTAPNVTLTPAAGITILGSHPSFTIGTSVSGTNTSIPPTYSINAPHSVTSNTTINSHTINIVPTTASYSAGILVLYPGGDTTMIPSGGPWSKSGTAVYLNNIGDNVGIGTSSPSAKLQVLSGSTPNDVSIVSTALGDALQINKISATGYGLSINMLGSSTGTAINISNLSTGPGIFVENNSSNNAIHARSTGSVPTIYSENWNGSGPAVRGTKSGAFGGNAGVFDIIVPSSFDALVGSTVGSGAAVRAISGAALNSTLALWVDNGHIKATGGAVFISTVNVSGGFVSPSFSPILTNCNDVKGTFSFTTTATSLSPGAFIEITLGFAKSYNLIPTVNATPLVDLFGLNYMVTNVSQASFTLRVYRTNNPAITVPTSLPGNYTFKFNYYILE